MNKINTISGINLPQGLLEIPNPPEKIWIRGSLPDDNPPMVAIVGTRKPTTYGQAVTKQLAELLARRGIVIVSGLAHGVDGIAHRSVIDAGGRTIAVMGCGLDTVYPASHRELAKSLLETGGALLSEYPPGTPPLPYRFLERNRLVIGLSDCLIITEAGLRSGTLNTASHALAQGKDVYVVPGNITSPMSSGCNSLIASGAVPITDIEEFVEQMAPKGASDILQIKLNENELVVVNLIRSGVDDGEALQIESRLAADVFSQTITMLEIQGIIRSLGANRWSL